MTAGGRERLENQEEGQEGGRRGSSVLCFLSEATWETLSVVSQRRLGDGVMLVKPGPTSSAPKPPSAPLVWEQKWVLVLVPLRPRLHRVCRPTFGFPAWFWELRLLRPHRRREPGRFLPHIFHFISCYLLWNKGGSTREATHMHTHTHREPHPSSTKSPTRPHRRKTPVRPELSDVETRRSQRVQVLADRFSFKGRTNALLLPFESSIS